MVALNARPVSRSSYSISSFAVSINTSVQSSIVSVDGSLASSGYQSTKYSPELLAVSTESKINKNLIEYYNRLYDECIIPINEFLSLVKENEIDRIIEIFTAEYFADLVTKIYTIQTDLTNEYPNSLPEQVTQFINNFVNTLYLIVDIFQKNIIIMNDNKRFSFSHEILQSLDAIRAYISENYNDTNILNIKASATFVTALEFAEPYNTYYNTYGFGAQIDPERLAAIQYELDQNQTLDT